MNELKQRFETDGFVRLPGFFDRQETTGLLAEIKEADARTSTLDRDGLFFRSSMLPSRPALRALLSSERVVRTVTDILGPDLWIRRDAAVVKHPGGAEFAWHQDNGYNQLLDPYAQLWIALTPMNESNGALRMIPGSHKRGLQPHRMTGTHFVLKQTPEGGDILESKPGDAVLFTSLVIHCSGPNHTKEDRIAYLVEFMSRRHFDPYTRSPYFMVSKNGKPDPKYVRFYEGNTSVPNLFKYVLPRTKRRMQIWSGHLKRAKDRLTRADGL